MRRWRKRKREEKCGGEIKRIILCDGGKIRERKKRRMRKNKRRKQKRRRNDFYCILIKTAFMKTKCPNTITDHTAVV